MFATLPNKPAGQSSQTDALTALHLPAGQDRGSNEPTGQENPAGQSKTDNTLVVVFVTQYVPAEQGVGWELVLPAGHVNPSTQVPEHADVCKPNSEPYLPTGHSEHDVDPAVLYVPNGQMLAV